VIPSRSEHLTLETSISNFFQIVASHAALAAWFYFGFRYLPLAAYIPLSLVASVIHQKFLSEWVHEAAHFNVLVSRKWNDRFINLFAEALFLNDIETHRTGHMQHHARDAFFDTIDPDTCLLGLKTRREFWKSIASDLVGLTAVRMFTQSTSTPQKAKGGRGLRAWAFIITVHLALVTGLYFLNRLDAYLLYYVTLMTLYPLVNRLRLYGQHTQIAANGAGTLYGSGSSRTIDAGFFDRVFFTSELMMYHYEHHRYPAIPYRGLKALCDRSADVNRFTKSRSFVYRALYKGLQA
jgi:fatty acid desaturase